MNDFNSEQTVSRAREQAEVDVGLRNFMLGVYAKMALGLLLTGSIAWVVATTPAVSQYFFATDEVGRLHRTFLGMFAQFLPLIILLIAMFTRAMASPRMSGVVYWLVVSSIGLSSAVWFLQFKLGSIAEVFLITATAFGAMSLWGYTTKRDLSGWGKFLFMAMWGVFFAILLSFLLHGMNMVIDIIGVVLFAAFTAYDTQQLKGVYYSIGGNRTAMSVATNIGALNFYLDFINMFQFLLNLGGGRR